MVTNPIIVHFNIFENTLLAIVGGPRQAQHKAINRLSAPSPSNANKMSEAALEYALQHWQKRSVELR